MSAVKDLLGTKLYTIDPWSSVKQAATIMEGHGIGCLPVVEEGKLVGIITSRDIKKSHPNRLVADAMTREVITIKPSASLWEAQNLIKTYKIERLVVADGDNVIGIVTNTHIMSELAKHVDILTGLNKAELFYEEAAHLLEEGHEIAIIFLDLDNFGLINKKYGHVYGDKILCQTAEFLKRVVDNNRTTLCRYAGDEFAILTIQPLAEAEALANQIVKAFKNKRWPLDIKLTISAGIAGGRRSGVRDPSNEPSCIVRNLVNLASLASAKAKKLKIPVVLADPVKFRKNYSHSHG